MRVRWWWAWMVGVLASCSSTPEVRYYRLASEGEVRPSRGELVIGVEPFAADVAYDQAKIAYRESPYRLDYYHYHRWSAAPGILVSEFVRDELRRSGRFRAVVSGYSGQAGWVLSGRVLEFDEVDVSEQEWRANVKLVVELREAREAKLVWSKVVEGQEPVVDRSPHGLAQAMTSVLMRVSEEVGREIEASAAASEASAAP